jgi:arsenate reductase
MYIVYGIPNCDTIKKTLAWLKNHKIEHTFHDYKKSGISAQILGPWSKQRGWESILNKKRTTWRKLDAAKQATIINEKAAISLMEKNTSMIKRPVIEKEGIVVAIGFDEAVYKKVFKQ